MTFDVQFDLDDKSFTLVESSGGSGDGLTEDIKQALLQIARKVAYVDDQGQAYYEALYDALYPPVGLVSISAVYTQSGKVYPSTPLTQLKSNLVVKARYDDGSSETITDYALNGLLEEGTSTITVVYYQKTTTFTVTVSAEPYTITNNLTNCANSNTAVSVEPGESYTGTITAAQGCYVDDTYITVLMGGVDVTSTVLNNRVITIAEVTGNVVITADAANALYPLKNGTHTFSNGCTVTVTGGRHVEITNPHTSGGSDLINISDISENTETSQTVANVQNGTKKFTFEAGQTAVFTIYNLVVPSNKVSSYNMYGLGTSGSLDIAVADIRPSTGSKTKTFESDTDVGCVFVAVTQTNMGTFSFDVSLVVDGVQYI